MKTEEKLASVQWKKVCAEEGECCNRPVKKWGDDR